MDHRMIVALVRRLAPSAAAACLLAASHAVAQEAPNVYGAGPPGPAALPPPPEELYVYGPRLRFQNDSNRYSLSQPPRASVSEPVSYADLDLRTDWGAQELRRRIVATARDICGTLVGVYPYQMAQTQSCLEATVDDGMVKAHREIDRARLDWRYGVDQYTP